MSDPLLTEAEVTAAWSGFASLAATEKSALIAAATGAIEAACGRTLGASSYREACEPGRQRRVQLANFPVTSLSRVATDPVLVLTATGPAGCQRATVAVTPEMASLASVASGVTSGPSDLVLASHATLGDLAAAIAGVSGWSASVDPGYSSWAVSDCEFRPGVYGAGPNTRCWQVYAYVRDLSDYEPDYDRGLLTLNESFWDVFRHPDKRWGHGRIPPVLVSYAAGYATAEAPAALKRACLIALRGCQERSTTGGRYQSESLGARSFSLSQLPPLVYLEVADLIGPWVRYGIA